VLAVFRAAPGQDLRPTARVDSNRIVIGDWLRLHLEVEHAEGVRVAFPSLKDSLEGMEIVGHDSLTRETAGGMVRERITYTITAFDSGAFVVPPLPFQYTLAGDSANFRTAETGPIPIFVRGVAVDTSKDIKDIKPPLSLSITFAEILPWLIGIVGAGLLAWLIIYIVRKRRRGESILPEAPPRPANELALEALGYLESEKLWQRGKVKEYHSQLSDIIRTYLERRFRLLAMEMVTDEILASEPVKTIEPETRGRLQKLLTLSDLVKFAKFQPRPEENEASLASARAVVEQTWRREQPAVPVQEAEA
jgi:hypothetical protein